MRRRGQRRRRKIVALVVPLTLTALPGSYAAYALTAPIGAATLDATAPDVDIPAAAEIALPVDGAYAVSIAGADEYLGEEASGIWESGGGEGPKPIASISKLVTALVLLDKKPLADVTDHGPTITFSRADHALYDKYYLLGATIAAMPTGSSMSQRQALEAMLIVSASNYAEAVSTWRSDRKAPSCRRRETGSPRTVSPRRRSSSRPASTPATSAPRATCSPSRESRGRIR